MATLIKRTYWATMPDGTRQKRTCDHYTIEYTDPATGKRQRAKGYRDKQATRQLAAKLELALARGKDVRDKRRTIADRDAKRQIERALKSRSR